VRPVLCTLQITTAVNTFGVRMTGMTLPRRRAHPPFQRAHLALAGALLALAAIGWAITDARMNGMDAGPGTDLGTLGFYVTAWVVMMAAMMFPSIVPMVLTYSRIERGLRTRGRSGSTAMFVAGYLVTWTAFGLLAYALFDAVRSLSIDALRWTRGGRYLAGGVIVAAAAYQLTPAKDACLRRCRGPFAFLTGDWRDGRAGALTMGALHGAWCVGCCWGLMVALFAVGVMSVGWMVFVAAIVALEKLLPWQRATSAVVALMLLALGVGVALVPQRVPGLTLPGSPQAISAMHGMRHGSGTEQTMPGMRAAPATGGMPAMPAKRRK
jgi:predicted metal-binding membrane protein